MSARLQSASIPAQTLTLGCAIAFGFACAAAQPASQAPFGVVLDRVVAVVNNHAILSTDLDDEIRLSILDPSQGNRYEPHWGDAANSWRSLEVIGVPGHDTGIKQRVYLPIHSELKYEGSLFAKHLAGPATLIAGGLLVGFGTRLANGCTSGHGVCGLARLSPRSLAATAAFMAAGFATVFVVRHVLAGGLQ